MEPALFELPLRDALIARVLARHYSDCNAGDSLDAALRCLARACWTRAGEAPDPYVDETAARGLVLRALDVAAESGWEHRQARDVFKAGRFAIHRAAKDPTTPRLHRTYWLMATRLWETCISDPPRRCGTECERPGHCESSENDSTRTACARSLVYPYLRDEPGESLDGESAKHFQVPNWKATVSAIIVGLKTLHDTGELSYRPPADSIRKALQRQSAAPSGKRSNGRARRS